MTNDLLILATVFDYDREAGTLTRVGTGGGDYDYNLVTRAGDRAKGIASVIHQYEGDAQSGEWQASAGSVTLNNCADDFGAPFVPGGPLAALTLPERWLRIEILLLAGLGYCDAPHDLLVSLLGDSWVPVFGGFCEWLDGGIRWDPGNAVVELSELVGYSAKAKRVWPGVIYRYRTIEEMVRQMVFYLPFLDAADPCEYTAPDMRAVWHPREGDDTMPAMPSSLANVGARPWNIPGGKPIIISGGSNTFIGDPDAGWGPAVTGYDTVVADSYNPQDYGFRDAADALSATPTGVSACPESIDGNELPTDDCPDIATLNTAYDDIFTSTDDKIIGHTIVYKGNLAIGDHPTMIIAVLDWRAADDRWILWFCGFGWDGHAWVFNAPGGYGFDPTAGSDQGKVWEGNGDIDHIKMWPEERSGVGDGNISAILFCIPGEFKTYRWCSTWFPSLRIAHAERRIARRYYHRGTSSRPYYVLETNYPDNKNNKYVRAVWNSNAHPGESTDTGKSGFDSYVDLSDDIASRLSNKLVSCDLSPYGGVVACLERPAQLSQGGDVVVRLLDQYLLDLDPVILWRVDLLEGGDLSVYDSIDPELIYVGTLGTVDPDNYIWGLCAEGDTTSGESHALSFIIDRNARDHIVVIDARKLNCGEILAEIARAWGLAWEIDPTATLRVLPRYGGTYRTDITPEVGTGRYTWVRGRGYYDGVEVKYYGDRTIREPDLDDGDADRLNYLKIDLSNIVSSSEVARDILNMTYLMVHRVAIGADVKLRRNRFDRLLDIVKLDNVLMSVQKLVVNHKEWKTEYALMEMFDIDQIWSLWDCIIDAMVLDPNMAATISLVDIVPSCACSGCNDEAQALIDAINDDLYDHENDYGSWASIEEAEEWLRAHMLDYAALLTALYDCAYASCGMYHT